MNTTLLLYLLTHTSSTIDHYQIEEFVVLKSFKATKKKGKKNLIIATILHFPLRTACALLLLIVLVGLVCLFIRTEA